MNITNVLKKVYTASTAIIVSVVALSCIICQWSLPMSVTAMLASIVVSSPATISLHFLVWLSQKIKFEKSFAWMLLMASIPPLALTAAWLFADFVPGKVGFVLLLGILSGYAGILYHGISVSQFFNSTQHGREENDTNH